MTDISSKQIPFGNYEYVDVVFGPANTDLSIPYTRLKIDEREQVRWVDVTPGEGRVYRPRATPATRFGATFVVLRSDVANYQTRLMLFVERNEANRDV